MTQLAMKIATRLLQLVLKYLALGENGVLWANSDGIKTFPALEVSVLDTVGAGDAFNSGFSVGISEDKSIEESIALGITAASISTQYRETIESYPKREEVDKRVTEII